MCTRTVIVILHCAGQAFLPLLSPLFSARVNHLMFSGMACRQYRHNVHNDNQNPCRIHWALVTGQVMYWNITVAKYNYVRQLGLLLVSLIVFVTYATLQQAQQYSQKSPQICANHTDRCFQEILHCNGQLKANTHGQFTNPSHLLGSETIWIACMSILILMFVSTLIDHRKHFGMADVGSIVYVSGS